jgi:phage FluMu protein gp41
LLRTLQKRLPLHVDLPVGYFDKNGDYHSSVTIGRSINARIFFAVKDEWQLGGEILFNALILQRAITSFGSLPVPVPMSDLLALDSLDFEHLALAYNNFVNQCGQPEILNKVTIKTVFGVQVKGALFDIIELGAKVTEAHFGEIYRRKLEGIPAMSYIVSQEVLKLRGSESGQVIEGPLDFDDLLEMDSVDLFALVELSDFCQSSMARIARAMNTNVEGAIEQIGKRDAAADVVFDRFAGRSYN